jgi:hypothetical protein
MDAKHFHTTNLLELPDGVLMTVVQKLACSTTKIHESRLVCRKFDDTVTKFRISKLNLRHPGPRDVPTSPQLLASLRRLIEKVGKQVTSVILDLNNWKLGCAEYDFDEDDAKCHECPAAALEGVSIAAVALEAIGDHCPNVESFEVYWDTCSLPLFWPSFVNVLLLMKKLTTLRIPCPPKACSLLLQPALKQLDELKSTLQSLPTGGSLPGSRQQGSDGAEPAHGHYRRPRHPEH